MSSLVNKRNRALKMMLWFGIGSLFMTFAGLTSAFIVSKNREDWVQNFDLVLMVASIFVEAGCNP